jgi:hypothetical protein
MIARLLVVGWLVIATLVCTQSEAVSHGLKDKPVSIQNDEEEGRIRQAIAPYIAQAKNTWPEVKRRYLKGLPSRQVLAVTVELNDMRGKFEVVFIEVKKITHGMISGKIASDILIVKGYKKGDAFKIGEGDILDWTILKPDGSEEGNLVGKYLDSYRGSTSRK